MAHSRMLNPPTTTAADDRLQDADFWEGYRLWCVRWLGHQQVRMWGHDVFHSSADAPLAVKNQQLRFVCEDSTALGRNVLLRFSCVSVFRSFGSEDHRPSHLHTSNHR